MSDDSGGSTSSTEPCDVPKMTNPVQEAQHEVAKSCSELTVDPNESLSLSRMIHSLSASIRGTASLPPCMLSTTLPVTSSLVDTHVKEDEEEHQNEDATQYSRQSSDGSSQDTLEDKDARTSQSLTSEDDMLTTPTQEEKIDSDEGELVLSEYSTSVTSTYCMIHWTRKEVNTTSNDTDETTRPLFPMDDDKEPPLNDQAGNADSGSSEFTSRLSLTFAKEESTNRIPNPPSVCATQAESASACAATDGEPKLNAEEESRAPVLQPGADAVPNAVEVIDKADLHRDSNNHIVANTGGITQGFQRSKVCSYISNKSQVAYNLRRFYLDGAKVECTLHPQGRGQDYADCNVTVTSTFHLPKYARNPDSIYAQPNCAISLSAEVYKGSVEVSNLLGKANKIHKLREEERQSLMVHVDVHNVASQIDIIYSRSSEMIIIRIVAELLYS